MNPRRSNPAGATARRRIETHAPPAGGLSRRALLGGLPACGALGAALALGIGGTGLAPAAGAQPAGADRPRVVASFSILADLARELLPPEIEVLSLVGPDADAHVYEPTPTDGRRIAGAQLVVLNGLGFEGWIDRMVQVSGYRGPLVVASRGIEPMVSARFGPDPHAWQDPRLTLRYVETLEAAFTQRWPEQRDVLARRAADYRARLAALDAGLRARLDTIPRERRRVITSHEAFGYFGAAYGIDFLAPQGWTSHSEPSAAAVARLIRQARDEGVRAIFLENISQRRLIERIAQEARAQVGGTLYSDALSAPGGPADTYLRMIEHNATSIATALEAVR